LAPSSLNWTPSTIRKPTTVTLGADRDRPETVDPESGAVIVTTRVPSWA